MVEHNLAWREIPNIQSECRPPSMARAYFSCIEWQDRFGDRKTQHTPLIGKDVDFTSHLH
jgi:hypothetical protein